jgi:hypothetical protein
MKKLITSALAGVAIAAPMALASATPAQAAPYKNCTQARQNNDCNIPSSSDKYQSKLDRDGDGLGCEC